MAGEAASEVHFIILGEGTTTCGEWLDKRRAEPNRVLPESAWALGYVTAASRYRRAGTANLSYGINGAAVDHWLDNHCAANPLDTIQVATDALIADLAVRAR